jgi:NitT/TauT family transport system ATP-binding protein
MIPLGSTKFICQHLYKAYQTRNGIVPALEDVTFSVTEREFVSIVGPSGCGKTTLLKLIAGLLQPTSGGIIFDAEPVDGRPRTALVFQEHGLFPWMTVLDNVAFGLEMRGVVRQERYDRAQAFIEKVGLASFADSYPHELSVGMRQRVGIARAFLADPHILLMDEPFGSLDAQTRLVLQEELLRIWKDHQKVIIYVTHDIEEAVLLGDRVLVMTGQPGRVREEIPIPLGRPRDLSSTGRPDVMEIKWHIWKILEDEVRRSLWIPA